MKTRGFTIVELLIVIVVIGILAAITVVAYAGISERAQRSKVQSDIAQLVKAVQAARVNTGLTLQGVTQSGNSQAQCAGLPAGTNLATLASSHTCWTRYRLDLQRISTVSGIDVNSIVDPWGRPYHIEQDEEEWCTNDTIALWPNPYTGGTGHPWTPGSNVPRSGNSGCSTS